MDIELHAYVHDFLQEQTKIVIFLTFIAGEKGDVPLWLENSSFKSDDALLIHQRHLDRNQKQAR
jgi:hypothetical protein